jgi:uncharacterized membrane protein
VKRFESRVDHEQVAAAIREAESATTAEIRVHISGRRSWDVLEEAQAVFTRLGMTATRERNGVLLYVAPRVHRFAVVGDVGIHQRCGDALWKPIAAAVEWQFREGNFTEGILEAVRRAGAALAEHFPRARHAPDPNELSDEVSED